MTPRIDPTVVLGDWWRRTRLADTVPVTTNGACWRCWALVTPPVSRYRAVWSTARLSPSAVNHVTMLNRSSVLEWFGPQGSASMSRREGLK